MSEAEQPAPALWKRFLAPYYICNTVALLVYAPIRFSYSSETLEDRNNYLGIPLVRANHLTVRVVIPN